MLIEVDVSRYYDWEKAPEGEKGARASADGTPLRRVVVEQASTTSINIPESEIRDQVLAAVRRESGEEGDYDALVKADPTLRARAVARYVEDTVMPWHAPRAAVVAARVVTADEGEVAEALALRLGVTAMASPPKPRSKRK